MTRPDLVITFHVEPADRGVGIMSEGFSAWDTSPDATAWCHVEDISPWTVGWYANDSGDACDPPTNHLLVEAALCGFVDAYYASEGEEP